MKYIVRKEMPGAKVGDILEENGGGALCKYGNTRLTSFVHIDLIQDALDQGFIEPYEEKPKIIKTTEGARDLNVKETPSTAKPKRGRPTEIKRDITKTSQSGLREGLTRATFIIREDTLDKLKERAYTDRKKLKDLVSEALDYYLDNDSIRELLKLDAISSGKSHIQDAIFQLEEAILKLQDNEVSDE